MSGSGNRGGGGGDRNSSSSNSFNEYGSKVDQPFSDRKISNNFRGALVVHQRVDLVMKQPIMYRMKKRELLLAKVCRENGEFCFSKFLARFRW